MHKDYCFHFSGIQNSTCRASYKYLDQARTHTQEELDWHRENYPQFSLADTALMSRVPCRVGNMAGPCVDFRLPSLSELEAYERKVDKFVEKVVSQVNTVRPVIIEYLESNDLMFKNASGTIPCPLCEEGTVQFSYAGTVNGHIHATCSTEGCAQWIE